VWKSGNLRAEILKGESGNEIIAQREEIGQMDLRAAFQNGFQSIFQSQPSGGL
jgi:hypothetical protein